METEDSDQRSDHCREEDISSGELMLTARGCGKFARFFHAPAPFSWNQYIPNFASKLHSRQDL